MTRLRLQQQQQQQQRVTCDVVPRSKQHYYSMYLRNGLLKNRLIYEDSFHCYTFQLQLYLLHVNTAILIVQNCGQEFYQWKCVY